jgi:hypothetical protein
MEKYDVAAGTVVGSVSQDMIAVMRGTKPWVLLIGVMLFVFAVLMIIGTLALLAEGSFAIVATGMKGSSMILIITVIYGISALVYLFLGTYLVKYNAAIGRLVKSGQPGDMEDALNAQRKFWRLSGIITLMVIILVVIGILAAIMIPLLMMGNRF